MTLPTSFLAMEAEFSALDRAIDEPRGIRIKYTIAKWGGDAYNKAMHFRMRLYTARNLDRKHNKELHEPGAPLHGRSTYDALVIRLKEDTEGNWWICLERNTTIPGEIEVIDDDNEDRFVPRVKPSQIYHPEPALLAAPIKRRF